MLQNNLKIISVFGLFIASYPLSEVYADTATTNFSAETTPGIFSMSKPNDVSIKASLTGKEQRVELAAIKTEVSDYRGLPEGYTITVKSPDYAAYATDYKVAINAKFISNQAISVYDSEQQTLSQQIKLPADLSIASGASAGVYSVTLEWNLQPNVKKEIEE